MNASIRWRIERSSLRERIPGPASFASEGHQPALDQPIERSAKLGRLGIDGLTQLRRRNGIATLRLERFEYFMIELLAAGFGPNVAFVCSATTTTSTSTSTAASSGRASTTAAFANDGPGRTSGGLGLLRRGFAA